MGAYGVWQVSEQAQGSLVWSGTDRGPYVDLNSQTGVLTLGDDGVSISDPALLGRAKRFADSPDAIQAAHFGDRVYTYSYGTHYPVDLTINGRDFLTEADATLDLSASFTADEGTPGMEVRAAMVVKTMLRSGENVMFQYEVAVTLSPVSKQPKPKPYTFPYPDIPGIPEWLRLWLASAGAVLIGLALAGGVSRPGYRPI